MKNLKIISDYLTFPDKDHFYFMQIIMRKKEHPTFTKSNKVIKVYYVNSLEYLNNISDEVRFLCDLYVARAYIHLNKRSYKKCAMMMLKNITDHILSEDYEYIKKSYTTVCGQYSDDKDKTWVIDIDYINHPPLHEIEDAINSCQPHGDDKIKLRVPTKNGIHLITKPFNLQEFFDYNIDVDVHKNNPTLLHWA